MKYVRFFEILRLNHKQCNKIKEKYVQLSFLWFDFKRTVMNRNIIK
jgi:hypothetical protein